LQGANYWIVSGSLKKTGAVKRVCGLPSLSRSCAKEPQPQPLQIEIVNAKEIGSVDKVLSVKRGDDGKMTGAVVQSLT